MTVSTNTMTAGDITAIFTAVGVMLNGMVSALAFYQSWKNAGKIEEVHLATNSMKDALVESTDREAYARGVKSVEASSININQREE